MGIATAGLGIYQTISAAKQQADAKKALNNYKRQELSNVADGLSVSTLGADLQREEQARLASTQTSALSEAGSRAILGGAGRVEAGNQNVNAKISADLDAQQKEIDMLRARDEANMRNIQENREVSDISALSSQYNAGQQNKFQGLGNIVQGTGTVMNTTDFGGFTPQVKEVNALTPAGLNGTSGSTTQLPSAPLFYGNNPTLNYGN